MHVWNNINVLDNKALPMGKSTPKTVTHPCLFCSRIILGLYVEWNAKHRLTLEMGRPKTYTKWFWGLF